MKRNGPPEVGAQELGRRVDCKRPSCINESRGIEKGPYAGLCDEHIAAMRKQLSDAAARGTRLPRQEQRAPGLPPAAVVQPRESRTAALRELMKLARAADAAKAKADRQLERYRKAKAAADKASLFYEEALRQATNNAPLAAGGARA